jgi:hypothetical protein
MRTCLYCYGKVPTTPKTTGRPAAYCSRACRRAAQSERQRITRHLYRIEDELREVGHRIARGDKATFGGVKPSQRKIELEVDRAALNARLLEMLREEGDDDRAEPAVARRAVLRPRMARASRFDAGRFGA